MNRHLTIVWFRQDLRVADHPALLAAAARQGAVIPVFIWAPEEEGGWAPGAASRWWLHHSLLALDQELRRLDSRLIIRRGSSLETLRELAAETQAQEIFWNRRYEPEAVKRDSTIKAALADDEMKVKSLNGSLLFEPWEVRTQAGEPYRVFTPFWKACLDRREPDEPEPAPKHLPSPASWPRSLRVEALGLEPEIDWATGIREAWTPGSTGAHARLAKFTEETIAHYAEERDRPDSAGTSRLSPHLHFGEISVRSVWHAVREHAAEQATRGQAGAFRGTETYLRELGWREFAHHLLFHFPETTEQPLRPQFERFPWADDPAGLRAWQRGQTGYPLVDAGMRELWATGWMHNRVRMIVASFLVKDLRIRWQAGAHWFWDTLVDADLANNTLGWQWSAGCGADAAPYFRIFNPVLQGKKFDPEGNYVRRWVPELAELPARWIQEPWRAPRAVLEAAGVELGRNYPAPIVDHGDARKRALEAFAEITEGK